MELLPIQPTAMYDIDLPYNYREWYYNGACQLTTVDRCYILAWYIVYCILRKISLIDRHCMQAPFLFAQACAFFVFNGFLQKGRLHVDHDKLTFAEH